MSYSYLSNGNQFHFVALIYHVCGWMQQFYALFTDTLKANFYSFLVYLYAPCTTANRYMSKYHILTHKTVTIHITQLIISWFHSLNSSLLDICTWSSCDLAWFSWPDRLCLCFSIIILIFTVLLFTCHQLLSYVRCFWTLFISFPPLFFWYLTQFSLTQVSCALRVFSWKTRMKIRAKPIQGALESVTFWQFNYSKPNS